MSGVERALARLASPRAVLAPLREGAGFGVFATGDRRRRPCARVGAAETRELEAQGAIFAAGEVYVLTDAGRARVRRADAAPTDAFQAQHGPIIARAAIDANGRALNARGFDAHGALKRLAALRDHAGGPFLSRAELDAAQRLRAAWDAGQRGLVRGVDWSAPPRASTPRAGGGAAQEAAMAAGCDGRARVARMLDALAPALRRVVESVCLHERGLEELERGAHWPSRSGKIALKLALAQLAQTPG